MIHLKLFLIFFKVGIFGFGGGYAILPMIFQEIQSLGVMTAEDFSTLVALSQVTPGPIAINAATYVGYKCGGLLGAVTATVSVSLPSFILILAALMFITRFRENRTVQGVLRGIKPATVGLMATAFVFMAKVALISDQELGLCPENMDAVAIAVFAVTYILLKFTHLGAITLTIIGAAMGVVFSLLYNIIR